MEKLIKQIGFIKEIDKLKFIFRKTKLFGTNRHENDAEHSWHLALMVLTLAEYSNEPVDILRVLKMVLIHDIVEIDAGDTFLYDTAKSHVNTDEELIAAERIFGLLPGEQKDEFISLWKEFEAGETADSKFAKAIDRLEPILQNRANEGGTWKEFNVSYEKVYNTLKVMGRGSETLWAYTQNLLNESVNEGILKKHSEGGM